MKCGVYTRTTTTEPGLTESATTIMEQNESIAEFVRARKWKIAGRYSDRKNDPTVIDGYMELRNDALHRRFDIIVAESIFRLGANIYQTLFLLQKTLYPAGIHFAFTADGFCSLDHDETEVEEYLNGIRKLYHGAFTRGWMEQDSIRSYFSVFGFHYIEDEKRVVADEETACIVKMIFQRLKTGEIPSAVAKELNKLGIITTGEYYRRERGFDPSAGRKIWNGNAVSSIARNEKYAGVYTCTLEGITIDVEPLVDRETFDIVQEQLWNRYHHKEKHPSYPRRHSITGFIWDKESGMPLHHFRNAATGHDDIRFRYPKEKDVIYDKPFMDYKDFETQLRELLKNEKAESNRAAEVIYSKAGEEFISTLKAEARKPLPSILERVSEVEREKIDAYKSWQNGDIAETDYRQIESACSEKYEELDNEISEIVARVEEIDTTYSDRNPWIKMFRRLDEDTELTKVNMKKILEGLYVYRFESVEIVPRESEWKNKLPCEWLGVV